MAIRRHRLPRFWLVLTLGLVAAGVGSAYWWEKQLPERLEEAAAQGRLDDCLSYGEQLAALRWLGGKAPLEQGRCRRLKAEELWRKGAWAEALKLQLQLVNSGTSTPADQQLLLSWQQQLETRALNLYREGRLEEALKLLSALNATHNASGTALGDQLSEEDRKEFLAIANAETDRLTRLVNDVLDLSRLESDRAWSMEPVELRPAMEQTLRNYRLNASDKGVELMLEVDEQVPRVRGNWDLLLQVFDNLVGNALKFTPKGGRLQLRAYPWPDLCQLTPGTEPSSDSPSCELTSPLPRLRIEISDSGCGISDADQERIFERFFRVENAVHTEAGTGLGLSIVRGILEKHGTRIRMASELGVGTTFWFDLPLEQADDSELRLEAERASRSPELI